VITHTSTAGRELSHPNETNDCTVIALAHVLGCPYADAHEICSESGRKPRHGLCNYQISAMLRALVKMNRITSFETKNFEHWVDSLNQTVEVRSRYGYVFHRRPRRRGTTVGQFVRTLPVKGSFYLTSTGHAFAYVDGKLLDNMYKSKMRALMTSCWEVKLPEAEPKSPITQEQINELWARLDRIEGKA